MIFKEIFVDPKEKELERLKEKGKVQRENYEEKMAEILQKPKKV